MMLDTLVHKTVKPSLGEQWMLSPQRRDQQIGGLVPEPYPMADLLPFSVGGLHAEVAAPHTLWSFVLMVNHLIEVPGFGENWPKCPFIYSSRL